MLMGLPMLHYISSLHEPHHPNMTDIFIVIYLNDISSSQTPGRSSGSHPKHLGVS